MAGIFGPDGKVVDREALNSVGLSMSRKPRPKVVDGVKHEAWVNSEDGGVGGVDKHHADGSVDVDVFGRAPVARLST